MLESASVDEVVKETQILKDTKRKVSNNKWMEIEPVSVLDVKAVWPSPNTVQIDFTARK